MNIYSVSDLKKMDQEAPAHGISVSRLMHNAGQGLADYACAILADLHLSRVLLLAGKGNNGGDALVAASLFFRRGIRTQIVLASPPDTFSPDTASVWAALPAELSSTAVYDFSDDDLKPDTLVIDGLLGTGTRGTPRGVCLTWIDRLNANHPSPILAVDLPSGLDAELGGGHPVIADYTATFVSPKPGMMLAAGPEACGRIHTIDIGMPPEILGTMTPWAQGFGLTDLRTALLREPFDTYKNRRGHAAIIGGSRDYPNAPFLSGESALRGGAGLVTVMVPENLTPFCRIPRSLIVRMPAKDRLSETELSAWLTDLSRKQAVALGPGLGTGKDAVTLTARVLNELATPLVLDADALNCLALHPEIVPETSGQRPWILTPHAGEMKRLCQAFSIPDEDRQAQAATLSRCLQATVVLKGCRTIVAGPDGSLTWNLTGSPALATAGSGDVLTGICAAMLAQGLPAPLAARTAVCLHGLLGELATPCGSRGVIADDLIPLIPAVFKTISPRL